MNMTPDEISEWHIAQALNATAIPKHILPDHEQMKEESVGCLNPMELAPLKGTIYDRRDQKIIYRSQ